MERRYFRGQVRAKAGEKPGLTGTAAVYNQEYDTGWFTETIEPGAFADVLKSDPDIRCLFNHNADNVLGRTKNGTLRIADSAEGLRYDCDTDETSIGQDVQRMVARGDVDGCSFSFDVAEDDWQATYDGSGRVVSQRRTIKRFARVDDVGPVTFPAYEGTKVAARSLWPAGVPAEIRSHIPGLRSDEKKTKRVDDEDLTADCFLIVGDAEDTSTWKLPWKFSSEEKTKSHLRNALARFDQLDDVSEADKAKAWKKLLRLCKKYDIDVDDETKQKHSRRAEGSSDADHAEHFKALVAVAHKIKTDCEEIVQAVAGAVEDPEAAIESCRDELEEIAKAAQDELDELPGDGKGGEEDDDAERARRMRLRLAEASL